MAFRRTDIAEGRPLGLWSFQRRLPKLFFRLTEKQITDELGADVERSWRLEPAFGTETPQGYEPRITENAAAEESQESREVRELKEQAFN